MENEYDRAFNETIIEEYYKLIVVYGDHALMSKEDMAETILDLSTTTFVVLRTYDRSSDTWRKALMLNQTLIDMAVTWNLGSLLFKQMKKEDII